MQIDGKILIQQDRSKKFLNSIKFSKLTNIDSIIGYNRHQMAIKGIK